MSCHLPPGTTLRNQSRIKRPLADRSTATVVSNSFLSFIFLRVDQHHSRTSDPSTPHSHRIFTKDGHTSLSRPPHASNTPLHVMSLPNGQIRRRPSSLEQHPTRSGEDARPHRRSASFEKRDPFSSPDIYYGDEDAFRKQFVGWSGRAVSSVSRLCRPILCLGTH